MRLDYNDVYFFEAIVSQPRRGIWKVLEGAVGYGLLEWHWTGGITTIKTWVSGTNSRGLALGYQRGRRQSLMELRKVQTEILACRPFWQ